MCRLQELIARACRRAPPQPATETNPSNAIQGPASNGPRAVGEEAQARRDRRGLVQA
jgi:hypothetical protein